MRLSVFVTLCAGLDGKKSFGEALQAALEGQRADPEVLAVTTQFVQGLVRAGALRIRVGSVEL